MRQGHLVLAAAAVFALAATGAGCSTNSGDDGGHTSGGQSARGGASGTGGATTRASGGSDAGVHACSDVTPCGGNVVGSWKVSSSCLDFAGPMDVSLTSLGCATVPVKGTLQTTGTFTANADGTYSDKTTTTGSVTFPLAPSCLSISSVPVECERIASIFTAAGWTTATCSDANGQCSCELSTEQHGGLGAVVPYTAPDSAYSVSGSTLTAENVKYSYCVSGNTLTLTPQMSGLGGAVILQKEGSSDGGSGGAAAGGGVGGSNAGSGGGNSGGSVSLGGSSSSGGAAGMSTGGAAGAASGLGGSSGAGGSAAGSAGMSGAGADGGITGPCDIYASGNNTCVAAHSTIRALFGAYNGNLYQVKRASDSTTKDIPVGPGGYADAAQQDAFCSGTMCTITKIYDQSGHGNFLEAETPDSSVKGHSGQTAANATAESLMVGGHKVYSLYTRPSQAYWRDGSKTGMPLGSAPQGIYIVTSGKHYNSGCCYDYGNAEVSRTYVAGATMDALYFGNSTTWGSGNGSGPWVMADLEGGIFAHGSTGKNNNLMSQTATYVTAIEKNNGTTEFALKAADATAGNLTTYYKGALPPGKNPMQKQGAIVLGSGGDCCYSNNNASQGTFYEGAIVAGYPSDTTDGAIQANVVSAGYGK